MRSVTRVTARTKVGWMLPSLLLAALALGGCAKPAPHADEEEVPPWPLPTSGDPLITLKRWAVMHRDNEEQVYYVAFVSPQRINDDNIKIIEGLTSLKYLSLKGTRVTDEGMKYVAELENLEKLALPSEITDASLSYLYGLKKLKYIDFGVDSGVNLAGVEKLKKQLPDCVIIYRGVFSTQ